MRAGVSFNAGCSDWEDEMIADERDDLVEAKVRHCSLCDHVGDDDSVLAKVIVRRVVEGVDQRFELEYVCYPLTGHHHIWDVGSSDVLECACVCKLCISHMQLYFAIGAVLPSTALSLRQVLPDVLANIVRQYLSFK